MRLIFLAPPGSGKGTQGARLMKEYNILQLSTGDILRENKKRGTKLGKEARYYMDAGELVPDEIITAMLKEEIIKPEYQTGFILDGFPRTKFQAKALEEILEEMNLKLDAAIILEVPKQELISRLSARRTCRKCGKTYHLIFNPPQEPDTCDAPCFGHLFQRADDTKETILNRLKVYERNTSPLIEYFEETGIAIHINGLGSVDEVYDRIKHSLAAINTHVEVKK